MKEAKDLVLHEKAVFQTIVWHITTSGFFSIDSFADYNGI